MNKNPDFEIKLILVGDINVGKTSIINSYTQDEFLDYPPPTVGLNLTSKIMRVYNKSIKVQIWDTAGQEEYMSLTKSYYRSTAAVIVSFDLTNKETFKNIDIWLREVKRNTHKNIVIVIVGCKEDSQEKEVEKAEGEKLCEEHGLIYYECSAKTGFGVKRVFEDAVKYVLIKIESGDIEATDEGFEGVRKLKNGEMARLERTRLRKRGLVKCADGCTGEDSTCCV